MIFLNNRESRKRRRVTPVASSEYERQEMIGWRINRYAHFAMDEFTPSELGEEYANRLTRKRGQDELYDSSATHRSYESDSASHSLGANYNRSRSTREDDEESETSSSGTSTSEDSDNESNHHSLPSISVINPTASPSRHHREEIMNFRPLNQKPNIFKFESPISQRLPGFLEKMAAANSQLQADIDAGKSADHRLEISSESESESESDSDADSDDSSEDDDSNDANDNEDGKHSQSKEEASLDSSAKSGGRKKRQYIEMNLALGVLEEKKDASDIKFRPDDDDSSSTSSSDESIMIVPRERVIKKATGTKGKKLITEV